MLCKEGKKAFGMFSWLLQLKDDCDVLVHGPGTGHVSAQCL